LKVYFLGEILKCPKLWKVVVQNYIYWMDLFCLPTIYLKQIVCSGSGTWKFFIIKIAQVLTGANLTDCDSKIEVIRKMFWGVLK
jgi:hypothetical protein